MEGKSKAASYVDLRDFNSLHAVRTRTFVSEIYESSKLQMRSEDDSAYTHHNDSMFTVHQFMPIHNAEKTSGR